MSRSRRRAASTPSDRSRSRAAADSPRLPARRTVAIGGAVAAAGITGALVWAVADGDGAPGARPEQAPAAAGPAAPARASARPTLPAKADSTARPRRTAEAEAEAEAEADTNAYRPPRVTGPRIDPAAHGADPTGRKDSTAALGRAVAAASARGGTVWFPAGHYRIDGAVPLADGVTLAGDLARPAVLTGKGRLGDEEWNGRAAGVTLRDLVLDGVDVAQRGSSTYKRDYRVQRVVFHNAVASFSTTPNAEVRESLFLSDRPVPVTPPVDLYKTDRANIHDNVIGVNTAQLGWLDGFFGSSFPGAAGVLSAVAKAEGWRADQGAFASGLFGNAASGTTIRRNVFNASLDRNASRTTERYDLDHAVYLWGTHGARTVVAGNWFRGWWLSGAEGGVKVRNGQAVTVRNNTLHDTSVLLYVQDDSNAADHPHHLKDVEVCHNDFRPTRDHGTWGTGISYMEYPKDATVADVTVRGNVFRDPTRKTGIDLTNGPLNAFTITPDNVYAAGPTVALESSAAPPRATRSPTGCTGPAGSGLGSLRVPSY
ncbi:glycosyl hydrolase family 28-related protein [Streptomyces sp. NPDC087440]|uniref:glycosyl hydrolase family 28-related protein n=1 Tax=Streptomyces sp. NPDC087440 TaxID=3365790 RepID=UPI0037F63D2C